MTEPFVDLRDVDVALNGRIVLRGVNWQLKPGENWAVLGGNGSGKSTFLKLVRGEIWPVPGGKGARRYHFDGDVQTTAVGVRERMGFVSPELQERYLQIEWTLSGLEVIYSGFFNSDYVPARPSPAQRKFAATLIRRFGVKALLERNVQQLSTGELRRLVIVRALVAKPPILVLDEVCDGLDAQGRAELLSLVEEVAAGGTQILFTTHRKTEFPEAITHIALFEDGRIVRQGPRQAVPLHSPAPIRKRRALPTLVSGPEHPLVTIEEANVYLDRKKVLSNVNWQVCANQNWAVFGANGGGKSTLLKLAFGDIHPAWGSRVKRFEFTAKNTIWDLRKRVGFVSPELQATYREQLSGADVVASGFFSSVGLVEKVSPAQRRTVQKLLSQFGLKAAGRKSALRMSYGEFRKMLLLRALVQEPELLICDEPFDGLDPGAKLDFSAALDQAAQGATRLIIVTHHLDDLPSCISHGLFLQKGVMVCQGEMKRVWKHPAVKKLFRKR
jgi:molybdate transport system ATP-binding protein